MFVLLFMFMQCEVLSDFPTLSLSRTCIYVKRWRIETTVVIVLIKCLTILCIKVKRLVLDVESCSFGH